MLKHNLTSILSIIYEYTKKNIYDNIISGSNSLFFIVPRYYIHKYNAIFFLTWMDFSDKYVINKNNETKNKNNIQNIILSYWF
jgi:hypothetical protein